MWAIPIGHGEPGAPLHLALRSDASIESGILGGDIVVRRGGWLARALRESCPRWAQEVLLGAERRLAVALATVHYMGGVVRIYRLGQPWVVVMGVSDHYFRGGRLARAMAPSS